VKDVGCADRAELTNRASKIHVIAGEHETPSAGLESQYSRTIGIMESLPLIYREQPQLVENRAVERGENRVGGADGASISRRDME
jgi:hypothetical protein